MCKTTLKALTTNLASHVENTQLKVGKERFRRPLDVTNAWDFEKLVRKLKRTRWKDVKRLPGESQPFPGLRLLIPILQSFRDCPSRFLSHKYVTNVVINYEFSCWLKSLKVSNV